MEKSFELVKSWNAVKGTRYQVKSKDGDSAIVKQIDNLYAYVSDDANVDRYFECMLKDDSKSDIWVVADKWSCKRWIKENPVVEEKVETPSEQSAVNLLGLLSKEIVSIIGKDMAEQVANDVKAKMDAYLTNKTITKVVEYNGAKHKIDDMTHEVFEDVLKFVAMNEPVFLVGPAGSGKNVICEQVAKALGLDFYFSNAVTQEYKLTGYGDAMGNFVETQFYKWCKNGGVFMLDEMDASVPEALIVLNCAIANGYFDFPVVGRVELHENCRLIACGNTWGNGASMEYVGRNQLDGATLNRFAVVFVNYDARIEDALAEGNKDVVDFCRAFRRIADTNGCHVIVSYREIKRLHKMIDIAKMDTTNAIKSCLVKGLENDTLRMIANQMSSEVAYRKNLLDIVNN